jgi:hypothetical protein
MAFDLTVPAFDSVRALNAGTDNLPSLANLAARGSPDP